MVEQEAPAASQRSHANAYVIGAVPVQLPVYPTTVSRSCGVVSLSVGSATLAGATAPTMPVGADVADDVPPAFDAVTASRNGEPASARPTVYNEAVAPVMDAHVVPVTSQRFHRYANEMGAVPTHAPEVPVSVVPADATPEIVGSVWFAGARAPTTAVGNESAVLEPSEFDAPICRRSVLPTSAGVTA